MIKDYKDIRVLFLSQTPLIKYGLKSGFDNLGCKTSFLDNECCAIWDKPLEQHIKLIMDRVETFKPTVIFTEGYSNLPINLLYTLFIHKGIQFHCWDIEADCTPQIGEYMSANCDFLWTTMGEKLSSFKLRNIKCGNLLFGCNADFHKPVPKEQAFTHDISLVARNYSNRYDETKWFVMNLLEKQKYDMMIYGIWWMDETRPVNLKNYPNNYWTKDGYAELPYEWLPVVTNSSKCMLGMNVPVNSNTHCSMRPYETIACSHESLMLAHYQPAQYEIFGEHMYHAKNSNEAELMVEEILNMNDEHRRQKAKIARDFVVRNHNYDIRARVIIDEIINLGI